MLDPARGPITPMRLADYRNEVTRFPMTPQERCLVLDQAQLLIDNLYVHLEQKRARYGVDPSRQLRRLARSQRDMDDPSFHRELMRIFDALRDMHTTYVLPEPYRGRVLLGFAVECYWDSAGRRRFIVSKPGHGDDHPIPAGAEITHWNGVPIGEAVQGNADLEAGGNAAARFARGLESLTLRNAALSPLPAEERVHIRYAYEGVPAECDVWWMVEADPDGLPPELDGDLGTAGQRLGYSLRTEMIRQLKADRLRTIVVDRLRTSYESLVRARVVRTGSGVFGHLRLYTFKLPDQDVERFLAELRRLINEMPPEGLIVDVRGNPGGHIEAAEGLLGLLTTRDVQPEPMQFVNSPLTYQLCGRSGELFPWRRSIGESDETGAQHSATLPLSVVAKPAAPYRGPVVLITDALAYSATDMFAAGFQDNQIGWVLGVDDNTGAGGANVWNIPLLRQVWPDGPLRPMPRGSRLTFALRRSLRVGQFAGRPVEDLGVSPDVRYRMTLADVQEHNVDLMNRAGRLLVDLRLDREQELGRRPGYRARLGRRLGIRRG
jgi:C-terminal processing protease CtpA/Prc